MLNWVQVQLPLRFAFRDLALLILLIRALPPDADRLALFAGGLLGLHVLRAVYAALVVYVNRHRKMPVVTRNIDLSEGLAGADRMAAARRELRHYLLGPDTPGPQERFNAAVAALIGDPGPAAAASPAPAAAAAPACG